MSLMLAAACQGTTSQLASTTYYLRLPTYYYQLLLPIYYYLLLLTTTYPRLPTITT